MATIVKIDSRSKAAKKLLEYIKTLPFVEVEEKTRYNAETEAAIADVRKGKTTKISLVEFKKQLH